MGISRSRKRSEILGRLVAMISRVQYSAFHPYLVSLFPSPPDMAVKIVPFRRRAKSAISNLFREVLGMGFIDSSQQMA